MNLNPGILNNWIVLVGEIMFFIATLYFLGLLLTVKRRSAVGRLFWWLLFCVAAWSLLSFISDLTDELDFAYWTSQSTFLAVAFVPLLFLAFCNALRQNPYQLNKVKLFILGIPAVCIIALTFSDANIVRKSYFLTSQGYASKVGPLYIAFFIYLAVYFVIGSYLVIKEQKRTKSRLKRLQLSRILIGSIGGGSIISLTHLILPTINSTNYYPLGSFGAIFFLGFLSYAVFRHRFLDIRRALGGVIAKFITLFSVFIIYSLAGIMLFRVYVVGNIPLSAVVLIFTLLAALTMPWVNKHLQRVFVGLMVKSQPPYPLVVRGGEQDLLDLATLGQKVEMAIEMEVKSKSIRLLAKESAEGDLLGQYPRENNKQVISRNSTIFSYLESYPSLLVREEIPFIKEEHRGWEMEKMEKAAEEMERLGAAVAIPLFNVDLYGVVLLGEKKNGSAFSVQDIKWLEGVKSEATMALVNVLMYKSALKRAGVKI